MDNEPKSKKLKTKHIHPIFENFLATYDKNKLERALKALDYGFSGMSLGALHVDGSNALHGVSFKKATIITSAHNLNPDADQEKPRGGFVGDIFLHGIEVLKKYLDKDRRQVPVEEQKREALKKLLVFFSARKDHKILNEEKNAEAKWSVTLAQHLLSKLAFNSTYTISSYPGFTMQGEASCLCNEKDQLVGKIGDTSFGCKRGWHGETDIIMEDDVSVSVIQDDLESEELSVSSVDVMTSQFCTADITQIMSQTVVFSFLQRKKNKEKFKNFLIPGIGIGAKSVFVCFYDSENDVLLQCRPINLFDGDSLNPIAVLFLWLTLNYRLFCSGVTEKMKDYKADFIKSLGDKANIYLDDVDRPMHIPHTTQEELFPWAPPQVLREVTKLPGQEFVDF